MDAFIAFVIITFVIPLGIVGIVAVIKSRIDKAKANRRWEMIRQDPEAYRQFREWELTSHKQVEDGIEKQKAALGTAAGVGLKIAGTIATMALKKK